MHTMYKSMRKSPEAMRPCNFLPLLSSCPHTPFFLGMRNDIAFDGGYCIRSQPPQLLQTEQRIEAVLKVTVFEVGAANDARVAGAFPVSPRQLHFRSPYSPKILIFSGIHEGLHRLRLYCCILLRYILQAFSKVRLKLLKTFVKQSQELRRSVR